MFLGVLIKLRALKSLASYLQDCHSQTKSVTALKLLSTLRVKYLQKPALFLSDEKGFQDIRACLEKDQEIEGYNIKDSNNLANNWLE